MLWRLRNVYFVYICAHIACFLLSASASATQALQRFLHVIEWRLGKGIICVKAGTLCWESIVFCRVNQGGVHRPSRPVDCEELWSQDARELQAASTAGRPLSLPSFPSSRKFCQTQYCLSIFLCVCLRLRVCWLLTTIMILMIIIMIHKYAFQLMMS